MIRDNGGVEGRSGDWIGLRWYRPPGGLPLEVRFQPLSIGGSKMSTTARSCGAAPVTSTSPAIGDRGCSPPGHTALSSTFVAGPPSCEPSSNGTSSTRNEAPDSTCNRLGSTTSPCRCG